MHVDGLKDSCTLGLTLRVRQKVNSYNRLLRFGKKKKKKKKKKREKKK